MYSNIIITRGEMVGEALRQAFMQEYEKEGWSNKVQSILGLITLWMMIFISGIISLKIIFPSDPGRRPFCSPNNINNIIASTNGVEIERSVVGGGGAFYLTDQETVDYYWTVVFLPSVVLFAFSAVYLVAGIAVSYAAPARHGCLKVVENNCCASKRGGVRCLSILNFVFAIIFGLLALFLGSTLLTLGSKCSMPLFWCYEISSWGLVMLYGGIAIQLRKKAATILNETDFAARNLGLEMLEASPTEFNPDVERRVNEGFRSWMGSAYLSSDDDDEEIDPNAYQDVQHLLPTDSSRQRV